MASVGVSIQFRSTKPLQSRLGQLPVRVNSRTGKVLTRIANKVMHASKQRVPIEDGHLISSAEIDAPITANGGVVITMSYGRSGPSGAYALAAHEHISEKYSPPSWQIAESKNRPVTFYRSGSGVKYLETPLREESSTILATVVAGKLLE